MESKKSQKQLDIQTDKRIKVDQESQISTSLKGQLEQIKAQLKNQDNKTNYTYKDHQIDEYQVIIKEISDILEDIKKQNALQDIQNQDQITELQFFESLKKSLQQNKIKDFVDSDIEGGLKECIKLLELKSSFFKGKLVLDRDFTYSTGYFNGGYSNIYYINDKENKVIIQHFELVDEFELENYGDQKLIPEINSQSYTKELINIKNLNIFIKNLILFLPQEKQATLNQDKLFQLFSQYFIEIQNDCREFSLNLTLFEQ